MQYTYIQGAGNGVEGGEDVCPILRIIITSHSVLS